MKYAFLMIVAVIATVLALSTYVVWRYTFANSRFTVINVSQAVVEEAEIAVCGQKFVVRDLKPHDKRVFVFEITGDSGYMITVRFDDGVVLETHDGYVPSGNVHRDKIYITKEKIEIVQSTTDFF